MYSLGMHFRLPLLKKSKDSGVFFLDGILFLDSDEIRTLRGIEAFIHPRGHEDIVLLKLKNGEEYAARISQEKFFKMLDDGGGKTAWNHLLEDTL